MVQTKKLSQQKFNLMDECARYKDLISGKDNAIKVRTNAQFTNLVFLWTTNKIIVRYRF